ncbi:MAG: FAD-linked oxidase C-terminal domain-containing protein, partial [Chloroflexota bacterium]
VVTEATVRLVPLPEDVATLLAVFPSLDVAAEAISGIIAGAGIIPVALELLDGFSVKALEESMHMGYPAGAGAVLLVELEGLREEVAAQATEVRRVCQELGAQSVEEAADEAARIKLWYGRKNCLGAFGTIAPHYYTHDMVVPRSKLPLVVRQVAAIAARHGFHIPTVAHAGDGNLHPTIIFDARTPNVIPRVIQAGREVLEAGLAAGGALSGEHGIGTEKRDFMPMFFSADDLTAMRRLKACFDPAGLMNPGKIFPL